MMLQLARGRELRNGAAFSRVYLTIKRLSKLGKVRTQDLALFRDYNWTSYPLRRHT